MDTEKRKDEQEIKETIKLCDDLLKLAENDNSIKIIEGIEIKC